MSKLIGKSRWNSDSGDDSESSDASDTEPHAAPMSTPAISAAAAVQSTLVTQPAAPAAAVGVTSSVGSISAANSTPDSTAVKSQQPGQQQQQHSPPSHPQEEQQNCSLVPSYDSDHSEIVFPVTSPPPPTVTVAVVPPRSTQHTEHCHLQRHSGESQGNSPDHKRRKIEHPNVTSAHSVQPGGDLDARTAAGITSHQPPTPASIPFSSSASSYWNPLVYGCRSVDCFERIAKIDEGTYGVVFQARDSETGQMYALKQVKMQGNQTQAEGFPITALRETNVLLMLRHENIINVREMVVGSTVDKIFMVMDYWENDLKTVMEYRRVPYSQSEAKCFLQQLLRAVAYLHRHWIVHRDLKPSNILVNNRGKLCLCDFGLARKYADPPPRGASCYTPMVITLWYRPPELLLGPPDSYSTAVDIWSCGCIFAELLMKKPFMPGQGEAKQLELIWKTLGPPDDKRWPGFRELPGATRQDARWERLQRQHKQGGGPLQRLRNTFPQRSFTGGGVYLGDTGIDLLASMLEFDPTRRISAGDALSHPYIEQEYPRPKPCSDMPSVPTREEMAQQRENRRMVQAALRAKSPEEDWRNVFSHSDARYN